VPNFVVIFLIVLGFFCFVSSWLVSDLSFRTKCIFTIFYLSIWGALYWPFFSVWLFPLAQGLYIIVVGGATFGVDYLMKER
jgi:hypothetical protein